MPLHLMGVGQGDMGGCLEEVVLSLREEQKGARQDTGKGHSCRGGSRSKV